MLFICSNYKYSVATFRWDRVRQITNACALVIYFPCNSVMVCGYIVITISSINNSVVFVQFPVYVPSNAQRRPFARVLCIILDVRGMVYHFGRSPRGASLYLKGSGVACMAIEHGSISSWWCFSSALVRCPICCVACRWRRSWTITSVLTKEVIGNMA